jgi:hypothetical protein
VCVCGTIVCSVQPSKKKVIGEMGIKGERCQDYVQPVRVDVPVTLLILPT